MSKKQRTPLKLAISRHEQFTLALAFRAYQEHLNAEIAKWPERNSVNPEALADLRAICDKFEIRFGWVETGSGEVLKAPE